MNKTRRTRQEKGITLVALIITIIVLLILAVVAIRAVQGDGIISKAKEAKTNYSSAQVKERLMLALNEWKITSNTPTPGNFKDFIESKLGEDGIIIDNGDESCTVIADDYGVTIDKNGNILDYVGYYDEKRGMKFILTSKGRIMLFVNNELIEDTTYKYADSTINGYSKFITVVYGGQNVVFAAITSNGEIYPNYATNEGNLTEIDITTDKVIVKDDTFILFAGEYEFYTKETTVQGNPYLWVWLVDKKTNTTKWFNNGTLYHNYSVTFDKPITEDIEVAGVTIPSGASKLKVVDNPSFVFYIYDFNDQKTLMDPAGDNYTKNESFNPEDLGYIVINN